MEAGSVSHVRFANDGNCEIENFSDTNLYDETFFKKEMTEFLETNKNNPKTQEDIDFLW